MDLSQLGIETSGAVEHGEKNDSPIAGRAVVTTKKKAIDRYRDKDARKRYQVEWNKKNYPKVAEQRRTYGREYYYRNRKRALKQAAERRLNNQAQALARDRAIRNRDRSKINAKARERKLANLDLFRKKQTAYLPRRRELSKLRRAENPTRKLAENCRSRICHILKREKVTKSQSTFKFIGCTAEFFREFLEHQFTPEMNWDNYGAYWNVDHVIPISKFHLHNADHLRMAFHYSNCRPLEAEKNSEKNDALPPAHQAILL